MSEVAPAGGGSNRLFVMLALGLVGLLVIGIVVFLLFVLVVQPVMNAARAPVPTPTRGVTLTFATTPARAALVVLTPTALPTDTPGATLVIPPVSGATPPVSGGALTPTTVGTGTVMPGTGTPESGMPPTGIGEDLLLLAGGIVLVFVIIAARRARSTVAA